MEHLKETIEAIIQLDNVVSVKEWNRLAQKYNFLSSNTLRKIYGKNFYILCRELRRENFNAIFNATPKKSYKKRSENI